LRGQFAIFWKFIGVNLKIWGPKCKIWKIIIITKFKILSFYVSFEILKVI
jgi:hypothetical protein